MKDSTYKYVSIIIPCRNEEKFISQCLESLLSQDYPQDMLEFLVIEGKSGDGSRKIVDEYARNYAAVRIIDNPKRIIPVAMNLGIKEATGEIIVKADAHTIYPTEYVSKCVDALVKYQADNVGGVLNIMSGNGTLVARAIALVLSSIFGAGNSPFRGNLSAEVQEVDTVAFGCYRRDVFERIGLYNENLVRSSDMDLNIRLKKAGGKILLVPDIAADYYAVEGLRSFWRHTFSDGVWATYPFKFTRRPLRPRHAVPLVFVSSLVGFIAASLIWQAFAYVFFLIVGVYFLTACIFSIQIGLEKRDVRLVLLMPLIFTIRHIGYGVGSMWGCIKIFIT